MKNIYKLLIVFCISSMFSQQKVDFEKLSSSKGVYQSVIYELQQDNLGNIWIATEEGVIRFNSIFSITYNKYGGLPKEVGNRISTLFIDSKDNIWIGTEKGICKYNRKLDSFEYVKSEIDSGPILVRSIIEDRRGVIWIGAFNGLWAFNANTTDLELVPIEKNKTRLSIQELYYGLEDQILIGTTEGLFVVDSNTKQVINLNIDNNSLNIFSISRNKSDYLIGTKNSGLYKIGREFKRLKKINFSNDNNNWNAPIRSILKEKNGNIYVGTDGQGIYYLDDNYIKLDHFIHNEDNPTSLSSSGVYNLLIDKENILWVATYGGGINYLDKNKSVFEKVQHILNSINSISSNFTRSIDVDKNGNYWFGTKKGVSVWNPKNNKWKHVKGVSGIALAIEQDQDYMWVGTYNNGVYKVNINNFELKKYDKSKYSNMGVEKVYSIFKDSKKNIWIGGIDGNVTKITPTNSIVTYNVKDVKSIIESNTNTILVAGRYGVSEIDINTNQVKQHTILDPDNNSLNYFTITAIDNFKKDYLILATNGAGIIFFNKKSETVSVLNMKAGMPSDIVQGIIPINTNEIWASTTKGLARINISEKDTVINVFDENDGLASTEYNYGSYKKVNENRLVFGGVNGITIFNPKEIKNNTTKPTVFFEEFQIFNKTILPNSEKLTSHINTVEKINLKYRENSITFKFVGILHNSPSKVKYSWKLDGFNNKWSEATTNNQVNFTNLNYGNYVFKVKAANRYGNWGEERAIKLTIAAPWWATAPAYFGYFILVVLLFLATIYITQLMVNKKSADEQIEFFNNLTHEIRTPLTILLSSLDNVSKSNDDNSKKQAKTTIKRLNSLFDQMLNFKKVTSSKLTPKNIRKIDVEKHIKQLINNFSPLLEEHSIKLEINNNWLKEVFYFDKEMLNKILFNLISNAIKYTPDGGEITINLLETDKKELLIQVKDTGIGIPKDQQKFILKRFYRARNVVNSQKPGTGLGLMMVKKIVEKTNGTISFKSVENEGTTFNVVLKNQEHNYKKSAILDKNFQEEFSVNEHSEIYDYSDRKILIVEDNNELRNLLSRSLGTYFQIYEASNGREGIEIATQFFPDIILTDLIMPEMDGLQMSKKIFQDVSLNHIPIFMMSVLNNSELKVESIESGISEYIEKPIDINLLLAKITNTLSWQRKLREKYKNQTEKDLAVDYRNKKDESFINNLEQILISRISDSAVSVYDLCESIGMSRTSLYMKLKNLIDLSPQDFIIHTKLKYSKKLLLKGDISIKEVAYQSGFSNPKYFSTSFKKFYGITPSGFLDSLGDKK